MSNIAGLAVVTGALIFSDPSIVISSREEYSERISDFGKN